MLNRGNVLNVGDKTREDTKMDNKRYTCEAEPSVKLRWFEKWD